MGQPPPVLTLAKSQGTLDGMRTLLRETVCVLALAAPIFGQSARDISQSGNVFADVCSVVDKHEHLSEANVSDGAYCAGFMLGFRQGAELAFSAIKSIDPSSSYLKGSMEDFRVCIPDGVTNGQLIRVTLKFIRENPDKAHLPTTTLIVLAELQSFPCEKRPEKQ